jgi:MFS family permease
MLTAGAIVQCTSINFPSKSAFCPKNTATDCMVVFIVARLFVGIGCGLAQASAPLLLTELCHPQHRGVVTACYNVFFNVGSLIATWLTYGTFKMQSDWSWRIPSLFQAVPSLLLVAFLWWIPESPRWLINNDRESEALAILAKYHANGDEMNPTVQFEFLEIRDTLRLETHAKRSSSYLDFFRTRGNRYRFMLLIALGLFSQWSGNGLTSYYFSIVMDGIGITDPNTQFKINGCNVIVSVRGLPLPTDQFHVRANNQIAGCRPRRRQHD